MDDITADSSFLGTVGITKPGHAAAPVPPTSASVAKIGKYSSHLHFRTKSTTYTLLCGASVATSPNPLKPSNRVNGITTPPTSSPLTVVPNGKEYIPQTSHTTTQSAALSVAEGTAALVSNKENSLTAPAAGASTARKGRTRGRKGKGGKGAGGVQPGVAAGTTMIQAKPPLTSTKESVSAGPISVHSITHTPSIGSKEGAAVPALGTSVAAPQGQPSKHSPILGTIGSTGVTALASPQGGVASAKVALPNAPPPSPETAVKNGEDYFIHQVLVWLTEYPRSCGISKQDPHYPCCR